MNHPIYRVVFFEIQAPYTLRVCFDDETEQVIDFQTILEGDVFGPLRDAALFSQVGLILRSIRWSGRTGLILIRRPCMTGLIISPNFRKWPSAGLLRRRRSNLL